MNGTERKGEGATWIRPKGVLLDDPDWHMVTNHLVQIENGTISAVVPDEKNVKDDVIEFRDDYVVPGLIDLHVHLDTGHPSDNRSAPMQPPLHHAEILLQAGITTVRDVGSPTVLLATRDVLNGIPSRYPRVYMAGRPITVAHGHGSDIGYIVQDPKDITPIMDKLRQDGVDLVKVMATAGGAYGGQPQFGLGSLTKIVESAHKFGLRVAAHAHSGEGIRRCIHAGVDTIEHASFKEGTKLVWNQAVAESLAGSGITAVFTPVNHRKAKTNNDVQRMHDIEGQWRHLHAMGVTIAVGTDVGVPVMRFEDSLVYAMETLEQAGIPATGVLNAVWHKGAQALGLEGKIGSIRVGAHADLIGVRIDPLVTV
ncbi:MAG: amidohydrolase family protein, partial [Sulfobacillus sp.]